VNSGLYQLTTKQSDGDHFWHQDAELSKLQQEGRFLVKWMKMRIFGFYKLITHFDKDEL
jgi:hypothetical protein